jgi:hypothetical protein
MRFAVLGLFGLLGLAACGPAPSEQKAPAAHSQASASPPAAPTPSASAGSCSAEIGEAAAQRLAEQCRAVSPATRPPCNVANSCAMIRAEIERSCALFAGSDPLPAELCPRSAPREAAAKHETPIALVHDYYAAIAARDYGRAYRLWADEGRASGKSLAAFAGGFAETATVEVEPGAPSEPEGAAGSTYVTVPVTVRATTRDGGRQRFEGEYVLRRVNGVPGATESQLDWRIHSASLASVR